MSDPRGCEEIRDLLPELAAGVAAGDERARALAHLATCEACRAELAELSAVVDELVQLAPAREPSPGFESAVLAAMTPRRRRWQPSPAVLAVAATLIGALLAAGTVWWQTAPDRDLAHRYRHTLAVADGQYFIAAPVQGGGGHGTVFAYEGKPSWLFVSLEDSPWSGSYEVQVVTTDGRIVAAGRCEVRDGHGSWGRTVAVPVHEISAVRLRAPGAGTLRATFRT